jgi:hypothetical protein
VNQPASQPTAGDNDDPAWLIHARERERERERVRSLTPFCTVFAHILPIILLIRCCDVTYGCVRAAIPRRRPREGIDDLVDIDITMYCIDER